MTDELTASPAGDAAVIRDLAYVAAARERLEISNDTVGFILQPGQQLETFNLEEQYERPTRKTGNVTVTDADSFVSYADRHSLLHDTTLWGDETAGTVTAVFDDHTSHVDAEPEAQGPAGWGQHRAVLRLRETTDWKHWLNLDGKFVSQDQFAEHIEDGVDAIVNPDAATMLEIAQTFQAHTGAQIDSGRRLSGEVQFSYTEQTTAGAGERGHIEIPDTVELALAPFEGGDAFPIKARFRFRVGNGKLVLGYRLIRPDRIRRDAFDAIIATVAAGAGFPVMAGTPRSA